MNIKVCFIYFKWTATYLILHLPDLTPTAPTNPDIITKFAKRVLVKIIFQQTPVPTKLHHIIRYIG